MKDDKAELIPLKFDDADYVIAVKMYAEGEDDFPVPPELGLVVPV